MQLGMIGLGRMGANMVRRLVRDGHECVVYDVDPETVAALAAEGRRVTGGLAGRPGGGLDGPRAVWMMVPAGWSTGSSVTSIAHLAEGDTVIDGGNSYHKDDIRRAPSWPDRGLHYVDVGVSGGVWGLETGTPDDRRRGRGRRPPRAGVPLTGPGVGNVIGRPRAGRATRPPPRRATCTAGRPAPDTS